MENIKVSLRLRPLNTAEKDNGETNIWKLMNECTIDLKERI